MTLKKEKPAKKIANIEVAQETVADDESETAYAPLVAASAAPLPPLGEADAFTIVHQLLRTQPVPPNLVERSRIDIARGAIAHYQAIGPRDGLESALARAVVGLNNSIMDSFGRATNNNAVPEVREIDLRLGIKAALALAEVVRAFDNHRDRHQSKVAVGRLNVEAGGRAIVANIERHEQAGHEHVLSRAFKVDTEGD